MNNERSKAVSLRPELRTAVVLAGIVFAVSYGLGRVANLGPPRMHLGAEYFHIARALADGRGFSDPFGEATGPTAWVPPIFPALIAAFLLLFKSKSLAAESIICLTNLALVGMGTSIYSIVRRHCIKVPAYVAVVAYVVWIVTFNTWFFVLSNDSWLIALAVSCMLWMVVKAIKCSEVHPWLWGVLGGVSALLSPAVGCTWGCMTALLFFRGPGRRLSWVHSAIVASAIAAPWTLRNWYTLHQFIPMKSNLAYEAYQAEVLDDDGIYDLTTTEQHPYSVPDMRFHYAQVGELAFVAKHKKILLAKWNSARFARKVMNRAIAATVLYVPMRRGEEITASSAIKRIVYPLPFLALVVGLAVPGPHRRLLRTLALLFAAYIAPYVLVAFYVRYLWPMLPVLIVCLCFGLDHVLLHRARHGSVQSADHDALGDGSDQGIACPGS